MLRGTRTRRLGWAAAALGLLLAVPVSADDDTDRAINQLRAVGREGKGNDSASPAWKALVSQGAPALFPTLTAVDDASPIGANWLRSAAGAIAEAETKAGRKLPTDKLEAFARDTKFAGSARRIAYELLAAQDTTATDRLLPGFVNDPNNEMRRDAIAAELARAEKLMGEPRKAELKRLFDLSRDADQVEDLAKKLDAEKVTVSVPEHFAFVTHWQLIGPFDSVEGKALTTAHPPEQGLALSAKAPGKGGTEVGWKAHVTGVDKEPMTGKKTYGTVDLNKAIGPHKDAAAYARAVIHTPAAPTPCEIRVTTTNAVQVFLNGQKIFDREEYHHGASFDHNVARGVLTKTLNLLIVKVCQNNQKEEWAQNWMFQARVCDATGGPLPGVQQLADGKPLVLGQTPITEEKK